MNTLFIVTLITFHAYLVFIYLKYGTIFSISNSYYALPKGANSLFTLYTWLYSIPLTIIGLDLFGTHLMFFAGMAIAFVGAAANFRQNELTNKVHVIGAGAGVVAANLSLIFDFKMLILSLVSLSIAGLVIVLGKAKIAFKNSYIYWAELVIIESMFVAIAMKLWLK